VIEDADVVVFVADSSEPNIARTIDYLFELRDMLADAHPTPTTSSPACRCRCRATSTASARSTASRSTSA
jgi:hypothetical protein